ncbi:hypothetical protein BGZ63DRAFT_456961 [Mariannaea sp. PMI_226]|nr:hypothetical protein BGZ63DRAFT_456961 [Mariannaea sp. PMI_226]
MSFNTSLERADITYLLRSERHFRDSKKWDDMRACYHPDDSKTFVNISWHKGGIDGFIAGSRKLSSDAVAIMHDITPVTIQFGSSGTKALAESTGRIFARYPYQGVDMVMTNFVRLFTQLEKINTPEGHLWKMLSLECLYMFETLTPSLPQPLNKPLSLDFSGLEAARRSYKAVVWHIGTLGGSVRDDLPGIDEPETVKEIEDRNQAWVNT